MFFSVKLLFQMLAWGMATGLPDFEGCMLLASIYIYLAATHERLHATIT